MDIPYSTCNAKGRCLRHPTIQLSRKKKLGGWKTILSICPMCAMEIMKGGGDPNDYIQGLQKVDNDINHEEEEVQAHRHSNSGECSRERRDRGDCHSDTMSLHSHDRPTHRSSSRGGNINSSSHQHHRGPRSSRPPSSHSSSSRHHATANQRYNSSSDDRSTHSAGHSIHSAPSTFHFHRRDSQESGSSRRSEGSFAKGGGFHNSSDSSCDTHTTVYSSDSSRRSHHSSHNDQQEQHRQHQRRPMGVPMRGHHDNIHAIPQQQRQCLDHQDEDEYVCGMPYQGMKYTGQITSIHAESHAQSHSRVPHGLGTLRSNDGTIWEGTWHFGRLLDDQTQEDTDELCEKFDQHTTIQDIHSVSEDSSVSNYSIAETIHGEYYSSVTENESSCRRRSSKQVMQTKMDEYSRYITHCDETQDYYYTEDEEDEGDEDDSDVSSISRYSNSSSSSSSITQQQYQHQHGQNRHGVRWNENLIEDGQNGRSRRVRFCEDP